MRIEKVLIIDDDRELCELLEELLRGKGFLVEVANRGEEGLELARSGAPSIVVLDVMMPGMGGFDVLRHLRAAGSRVPVLMLTARGDDIDRIVGLEGGADDYLPKPFNRRELVARIEAILRRTNPPADEFTPPAPAPPRHINVGDVEVETGARRVLRGGELLELTGVEYEILVLLLSSAGRVVRREELARTVLGRDLTAFDRSLDMHISRLRRKLGPGPKGGERIRTVRGVGYVYSHPATTAEGQG